MTLPGIQAREDAERERLRAQLRRAGDPGVRAQLRQQMDARVKYDAEKPASMTLDHRGSKG